MPKVLLFVEFGVCCECHRSLAVLRRAGGGGGSPKKILKLEVLCGVLSALLQQI